MMTQDKETLREAVPSYREAKAALEAAKCPTCMGLGTCDDASPHDISFNTWECRDCGGTGLRNENFIQPLIDAAIATMFERLRTPSEGMLEAAVRSEGVILDDFDGVEIFPKRIWQAMLDKFQQENGDER